MPATLCIIGLFVAARHRWNVKSYGVIALQNGEIIQLLAVTP